MQSRLTAHPRLAATGRLRITLAATVMTAMLAALLPAHTVWAQTPTLTVEQGWGFATLAWDPVDGATEYQIERTLLDGDEPAGPGVLVGRWLPNRHIAPDGAPTGETTFADAGFQLGERYRWRIRAVVGGTPGDWSGPVHGDTLAPQGPAEYLTGFELSGGASWTLHSDEVAVVEAIAAASDRVRLETIGETYEGRPLHLATLGHPAPRSAAEIVTAPSVLISCTVHGGERSGREACLMLLRQLAFSDDPWVTDLLAEVNVLINPTANPDGQSVGRRTNTAGQDLNRDHMMLRHPEAVALSEVIRDLRPDLIVDAHEMGSGADTAPMWPRSLTVHEDVFRLSQDDMTLEWHFGASHESGFWLSPYAGWANNNWENWLHNVAGLKNALGQLLETPTQSGATRPNAPGGSPQNMQRRVYTQLWSFHTLLEFYQANIATIQAAVAASEAAQSANEGPIYIDGAYDPPFQPPRLEPNTVVLDPYCGYRLDAEQYATRDSGTLIGPLAGQPWASGTVEERLVAHGIEVAELGDGIVQVPLAQRLRAVIPYILDPELDTAMRPIGTPNLGMVDDAVRLDDRSPTVVVGGIDTGVPNRVDDLACSINDLIADEQAWSEHGRFVSHVTAVVNGLRSAGLVNDREAGAIVNAAGRSGIGE